MKYAVIRGGVAVEVVHANPAMLFVPDYAAQFVQVPDDVCAGWMLAAGEWSAPQPPAAVVPQSVTMRQARLALLANNMLANVQTAINSLPEPDKTKAQIEWEYSNALERNNSFVATLGAALGLNAAALDALFIQAAQL